MAAEPTMISKKICMLGSFAVGKTSLVQQYVHSIFSDKYLTTIGVKVDKKEVTIGNQEINLLIWDVYGEEAFQEMQASYLRGASGYLLVADGTRKETLDRAYEIHGDAEKITGGAPFMLILNKWDLTGLWEIEDDTVQDLTLAGMSVLRTSAKTGHNVEEAFRILAEKITAPS